MSSKIIEEPSKQNETNSTTDIIFEDGQHTIGNTIIFAF
jgi:hypothetical protein